MNQDKAIVADRAGYSDRRSDTLVERDRRPTQASYWATLRHLFAQGRRGAAAASSSVFLVLALSAALAGCVAPSSPERAIDDDIAASRDVGPGTLSPGMNPRDEPL